MTRPSGGLSAVALSAEVRAALEEALLRPEDYAVRLIDMPWGVGAAITIDEDGFASIYLNARLSHDARQRALRHELWHLCRGDMFREADIRRIEGEAPVGGEQPLCAMDGAPLAAPAPVFDPAQLRRVGRGLYLPEGGNLERAEADLRALAAALLEGCRAYDVLQRPPLVPVARLEAACVALSDRPADAIAFVAWCPRPEQRPVVLQFCSGGLEGALYYAADGAPRDALALLDAEAGGRPIRLTFDVRRRRGILAVCAIHRALGGGTPERVY